MNPHIHISALEGLVTALYVIVFLGAIHIIARKFEGHPFADAALDFLA
jgi:hypothetical protein